MASPIVSSGVPGLDEAVQGLRLGDSVLWQVDNVEDYRRFASRFSQQSRADGRCVVYLRFAEGVPILTAQDGVETIELTPPPSFDAFALEALNTIERLGPDVFYVFDNLSVLADRWSTDELLANWFQVTAPHLQAMRSVAYCALGRGWHAYSAVARIHSTPPVILDAYWVDGQLYVHPVRVRGRHSRTMFLPHIVSDGAWLPVLDPAERMPPNDADGGDGVPEIRVDTAGLKLRLSRTLLGSHRKFDHLADEYFSLDDLTAIRSRLVGTGRIGGKAAGMLLAGRILRAPGSGADLARLLEYHDSFYIGSDTFLDFLLRNGLYDRCLGITTGGEISRDDFQELQRRFVAGKFPVDIVEQLRNMLDYYGQAPIIARSSSLLEDSFGNAFAGKYYSECLANQGGPEERLAAFEAAIKRVYASALNPDALSYRKHRGLNDSNEQMAVLVQRISGMPYGDYFFPSLAGVAFSRNMFAWSPRIDPTRGVIRLVFGLGTRAVDRVGGDYPRMLPVSAPLLRPETGSAIVQYSQQLVDLLDLRENKLTTLPTPRVLKDLDYPGLHLFVSEREGDHVRDPVTKHVEGPAKNLVLTFNNLLRRTEFVRTIDAMLSRLDREYEQPVDIEFTAHLRDDGAVRVNLLQCRPITLPGELASVCVPENVPPERVLFRASSMVNGGEYHDIRHILLVDPRAYAKLPISAKRSLGREVGRINVHPDVARGKLIMMGPGRWGSSNVELGVNVGYADIDNTAVLVELAYEEAGQAPEVSYGTHFFQDLVEAQIVYLPVYPDDLLAEYNATFFDSAPNALASLLPDSAEFAGVMQVIDVRAASGGLSAHVVADPHAQRAVCYLG